MLDGTIPRISISFLCAEDQILSFEVSMTLLHVSLAILLLLCVQCSSGVVTFDELFDTDHLFYIYDWPHDLQSSWPLLSSKDVQFKTTHEHYEHYQSVNFGFGELLDEYVGMYKSNQYQLYTIIMSKLRVHPRRTFLRENATIFVIPYDIGAANQWRKSDGMYVPHSGNDCPTSKEIIKLIKQELSQSKHYGHDHLIINSLYYMFGVRCMDIFEACANCTVIAPDVPNHNQHPVFQEFRADNRSFPRRWYGVPFPSAFHWHDHIQQVPWNNSHRNASIYASIWVNPGVQQPPAVKLRKALAVQCEQRPKDCANLRVRNRHHNQCYKSGAQNCMENEGAMTGLEAYNASIFCMQPPGDLMGRKGIFDSFLAGCIPVMFNYHVLSKSYPWWFPADGYVEGNTTAYISHFTKINPKFNSIDYLKQHFTSELILKMQKQIEHLGYLLQYAKPPARMAPYIGHAGGPGEIYR